jgi:hypothetical protein
MPARWPAAALLLAAILALGGQTAVVARTGFLMGDFRAFYCAARVAAAGENPYRAQPLRTCEIAVGPMRFFEANPGITIPAPLPGYVVGTLVPLAALPFTAAAVLWALLSILACGAAIVALARVARLSWPSALALFALSLCAISLPFGEVVPVALAGICGAAYFAMEGRWTPAALCAAAAMIEPHIGLPVCIALAVWAPAARVPLALSFGFLAAVSIAVLGPATNIEYFTGVLPAHALSEVGRDSQYSLTAVLYSLGAPQNVAVRAGALWYVAMLVIGAYAGGLLAKKNANGAFIVCVPPAFAVFGGTFIHATQIAAAIPAAALLLASYAKKEQQRLALTALLGLALPWGWAFSPALIVAPAFPGFFTWQYWNKDLRAGLIAAVASALLWLSFLELGTLPHAAHLGLLSHSLHPAPPAIDARLAEATWSSFSQRSSANGLTSWLMRIPTWAALGLLLVLLTRECGILRFSGIGLEPMPEKQ